MRAMFGAAIALACCVRRAGRGADQDHRQLRAGLSLDAGLRRQGPGHLCQARARRDPAVHRRRLEPAGGADRRDSQIAGLNPTIVLFADEGGADLQIVAGANGQAKTGRRAARSRGRKSRSRARPITWQEGRGARFAKRHPHRLHEMAQGSRRRSGNVTYIEVPINQMNDALKNGQVDIALPAAPFTDQISRRRPATMVADYQADLADPVTVYSVWAMLRG